MSGHTKKTNTPREERSKELAKRTIQLIGFAFATALTIFKLANPDSDIPWWVIFGFFGFGVSANVDIIELVSRSRKR